MMPLGPYPSPAANGGTPTPSRFVPHSFQYNGRVALALLVRPQLAPAASLAHFRAPVFATFAGHAWSILSLQ